MSTTTVTHGRLVCDQDPTHHFDYDIDLQRPPDWHSVELPPGWVEWTLPARNGGAPSYHFSTLECLERFVRELGVVAIGRKHTGEGDVEVKGLDEVLGIRARSLGEVLGCSSCGGRHGKHVVGCSIVR